jgi:hypothetical protein
VNGQLSSQSQLAGDHQHFIVDPESQAERFENEPQCATKRDALDFQIDRLARCESDFVQSLFINDDIDAVLIRDRSHHVGQRHSIGMDRRHLIERPRDREFVGIHRIRQDLQFFADFRF